MSHLGRPRGAAQGPALSVPSQALYTDNLASSARSAPNSSLRGRYEAATIRGEQERYFQTVAAARPPPAWSAPSPSLNLSLSPRPGPRRPSPLPMGPRLPSPARGGPGAARSPPRPTQREEEEAVVAAAGPLTCGGRPLSAPLAAGGAAACALRPIPGLA